jgi:hypothetical protein
MLQNSFSVSAFGFMALTALVSSPAIAEPTIGIKASEFTKFSYSASDLLIGYDPVDLEAFCERYPFNSRCSGVPRSTPESEPSSVSGSRPASNANSGFAITPEVSTLGLGASLSYGIFPQLNGRLSLNGFSLGVDVEDTEVTYDSDVNLFNISALADYYPIRNSGLKLSAGLVLNDNNISGTATANSGTTIDLGDSSFNANQLSSVDLDVEFPNEIAPYIGIGWGNPVRPGSRWSFNVNLGVMFPGSPEVDVQPNIDPNVSTAERDQIEAEANQEEADLEDDLDNFNIYPVLTIGVSYQF